MTSREGEQRMDYDTLVIIIYSRIAADAREEAGRTALLIALNRFGSLSFFSLQIMPFS